MSRWKGIKSRRDVDKDGAVWYTRRLLAPWVDDLCRRFPYGSAKRAALAKFTDQLDEEDVWEPAWCCKKHAAEAATKEGPINYLTPGCD